MIYRCNLERFVYYETLVTTLKQLGVKSDIVEFEELKKEKQKQTLYGLLETASILSSGTIHPQFIIKFYMLASDILRISLVFILF